MKLWKYFDKKLQKREMQNIANFEVKKTIIIKR